MTGATLRSIGLVVLSSKLSIPKAFARPLSSPRTASGRCSETVPKALAGGEFPCLGWVPLVVPRHRPSRPRMCQADIPVLETRVSAFSAAQYLGDHAPRPC